MENNKFKIQDIVKYFGYENPFTSKELYQFYLMFENDLNQGTFRWRVYRLKEEGIMRSLKRGVYILETRKVYKPKVNLALKKLFNDVKRSFPYIDICIWNTSWLHDFMNHQPFNSMIILEVDRDVTEVVFQFLREKRNEVYLSPKAKSSNSYILGENGIIVKQIVKEEVPIMEHEKVVVPKIEKILVDIFFESQLFISYQGQEKINIFERVYDEYSINASTVYRYARNRGIKENIKKFILENTNIDKKYI